MRATTGGKKKQQASRDWHPAQIVAAVRMAGTSIRQLSLANGLAEHTLKECLRRPYPKAEAIVAKAIGRKPDEIWPSRYPEEAKRERAAA